MATGVSIFYTLANEMKEREEKCKSPFITTVILAERIRMYAQKINLNIKCTNEIDKRREDDMKTGCRER